MTTRATAFGVGMLAGLAGWAAIGGDDDWRLRVRQPREADCAKPAPVITDDAICIVHGDPPVFANGWLFHQGLPPVTQDGDRLLFGCRESMGGCFFLRIVEQVGSEYGDHCVNGHPRHRVPGVTYGHKPAMRGHERDHYIPLGLGGPDIAANVHYQILIPFAEHKNDEERELERAACAGEVSFPDARQQLAEDWPLDAAHGYDMEGTQ